MNLEQFSTELEQLVERVSNSVVGVQAGGGAISRLVVKPEHVLTIDHVLERNDAIDIVAADGALTGEVIGRDQHSDLAVVRVPELTAKPLERMEDLVTALSQTAGRGAQLLELSRGGQALSIHVTVTERTKSSK